MSEARKIEQHAAIRNEIKDYARQLMAQEGTAGLSMRAIARAMQMTAPALYHYYTNREALITDLIAEAFNALGEALEQARDGAAAGGEEVGRQLLAVVLAYREWALAHPIDFQLIYGNPLPGYVAPREITVPAATRSYLVVVGLIDRALSGPHPTPAPEYRQVPPELLPQMTALAQTLPEAYRSTPLLALYLGLVGWPRLHGIIMLELFEHIQPVAGDSAAFYRIQMEDMFHQMGVEL